MSSCFSGGITLLEKKILLDKQSLLFQRTYWKMTNEPIIAKGRSFLKWPLVVLFSNLFIQTPENIGNTGN